MSIDGELLGLDVGQSHMTAVRLVERTNDEGQKVAEPLLVAEYGIPRATFSAAGHLLRPEIVTAAVRNLRRDHKLRGQKTVLGMTGAALSVMPLDRSGSISAAELETSIRLQIEPGLAYSGQAHISHDIIKRTGEGEAAMVRLLTVAVPRSVPTMLAKAVNQGGLDVVDVLPEPCVLPRAIDAGRSNVAEILLNVGIVTSNVMLVRNGKVQYCQSLDVGGDHFTQALVSPAMNAAEAERFKRRHSLVAPRDGADPYAEQRVALRNVADRFMDGIYEIIHYSSDISSEGVGRLVLSGGGARLSGLPGYLNSQLGVPVELGCPAPVLGTVSPEDFPRHALAYALALTPADQVRSRR